MKIAIIGYGKMGKMIESVAIQKGHMIGSRIDVDNPELLAPEKLRQHDVAIEFSTPETAYQNVSRCLDAGLPVVCGSTGWTKHLDEIVNRCKRENKSFLYASNFNLGVNILFHLNRQLAAIMNHYDQYHVSISEIHHIHKLDAPSGTAITLADGILEKMDRMKDWSLKTPVSIPGKDSIVIEAIRAGTVAGVHEVIYESDFDTLSIRHAAKDRRGFAIGAILAAEYIHDKKGIFTMKDVLDL